MEDTLGFVDAAAVDSHRRDGAVRWRCEMDEAAHGELGLRKVRNVRAQQRAVDVEDRDMVGYPQWSKSKDICWSCSSL